MLGFDFITRTIDAILVELTKSVTGKIFTKDEIRAITTSTIGKHLADWFPEPADERTARERVEEARVHIQKANLIITGMQEELSRQTVQLDRLLEEVAEKKKISERYSKLAATNREQFRAFKRELEESLQKELFAQIKKGRGQRQAVSAVIWLVTLVLGAWLGTYFKEVVAWIMAFAD